MKTLFLLLAVAPLRVQEPAREPVGPPAAEEVLARVARAVHGGRDDVSGSTLVARGTAQLDDQGPGLPFTEAYDGLRRARITHELGVFGTYEVGCDGTNAWEHGPFVTTIHRDWEASFLLRLFGITQHVPWTDMYSKARSIGRETVEERSCWVLDLTPRLLAPGSPEAPETIPWPDRWYVDAETSLPRRVVMKHEDPWGNPELAELVLDDWRAVDGVRYPHDVVVRFGALRITLDYLSYERDAALPDGYFALGEELRAELERSEAARADEGLWVERVAERPIAAVRLQCEHEDLKRTLAVVLGDALRYVQSVGAATTGPPLVRYHTWGATLDIEAGMPVAEPVAGNERVRPGVLPEGLAVHAWHVGPYEELGRTHERVSAYLERHGLERRGGPWEEYWTDPGLERDPGKWRTKIVQPVRRVAKEQGGR